MPAGKRTIHLGHRDVRVSLSNGIALALSCALIVMFFHFNGLQPSSFTSLFGCMESTVYGSDTAHYPDGNFGVLKKGERAEIALTIPGDGTTASPELYFPLYNAIVNVYLDGDPIFLDAYDADNPSAHYGNRIYEIPLPGDYPDHALTLEITALQRMAFSELNHMGIVSAHESWKDIIGGSSLLFVMFLTILSVAALCALYALARSVARRKLQPGLPIALFEVVLITWFFGSQRMFYLILGNVEICAKAEYYALYLIPLPLAQFIYMTIDKPAFKRLIRVAGLGYLAYYLAATAVELSPLQINYSDMTTSMHPLRALVILLLVVSLFFGVSRKDNPHVAILRYGTLASMVFGIAELVRFNIDKYTRFHALFTINGVSLFSLLIIASFTVSVVLYVVSTTAEEYTLRIEHRQLKELAYRDALTGMPNRAECYRQIERMAQVRDYSMVFIDLNNLKTANDVYGHQMGDRLLKAVADAIVAQFSEGGFCARWGGDEFVACVFDVGDTPRKVDGLQAAVRRIDASGQFPFQVSVACGAVSSSAERYIDPVEAIRQADAIMYENKKRMKMGR